MAKLLQEIEWSEPLLTPRPDASPEVELQERLSPWLRKAVRTLADPDRVTHAPLHLMGVSYFVASQENACRYCYGMARAIMKIVGFKEKQIQDLYEQRSMSWACLIAGVALALISVPLLIRGGVLGPILLGVALLFGLGALFMFAGIRGQMAADRAIQEEYEHLVELYGQAAEKPKRGSRENVVQLSDDGELMAEDSPEDHLRTGSSSE